MTRRPTGNFQIKPALPIGHLTNKSTVCCPVSMSYMAQDLVRNHMKSHYRRVSSAKACVDTSPPQCMKLTIKEKDRKRREALQHSGQSSPRTSRQNSPITSQKTKIDFSSTYNYDYSMDERTMLKSSINNDKTQSKLHNKRLESDIKNDSLSRLSETCDHNGYSQYERTRSVNNETLSRPQFLNERDDILGMTNTHSELMDSKVNQRYSSTPTFGASADRSDMNQLDISRISFSYKRSPTRKTKKSTTQEVIWMEEQKYLNFITDVTNDVLARGIFSNRVLNRVFQTHIENKKHELNEERMRGMIDQLKEDLGITANN